MTPKRTDGGAKTPASPVQRRRGAVLVDALLDAAWDELVRGGYAAFTMDAVATRAQTSRAVIYRRWASRDELAFAAMRHHADRNPVAEPNTGNLRGDLILLLQEASARRSEYAVLLSAHMAGLFEETGATLADLRERFLGERANGGLQEIIFRRAIERGELDAARLTPRLTTLAFDLVRHELLMTQRPVPDHVIVEIVDEVVLPVLQGGR